MANNNRWASDDDAGDLLADIFSDTESAAEVEAKRIEAELERKKQEEAQRAQEEEQRRIREAEAKLQEEAQRQQNMTERRTARLEAIKVEEMKARGEWVDPAIEEAKRKAEEDRRIQEEARRQAEAMVAQQAQHAPVPQAQPVAAAAAPEAEPPKSKLPYIILAAVFVAILGAGGAIAALTTGGYTPDTNPYAKITLEPKEDKDLVIVKASKPIPSAKPAAVVASNDDGKSSKTRRKSRVRRKAKAPSKKKKTKRIKADRKSVV